MPTRNPRHALDRAHAALLVVDVQERLGAAMDPAWFERSLRNTDTLHGRYYESFFGVTIVYGVWIARRLGRLRAADSVA